MDSRGVSMPLQYVLLVAIIGVLAGGLFVTAGGYVQNERADAVEHGLEVVGARLATDIVAADRLAGSLDGSGSFVQQVDTPETVAGSTYVLTVTPIAGTDRSLLTLESRETQVTVEVEVRTTRPVANASVAGGDLAIRYDAATDSLEVQNV